MGGLAEAICRYMGGIAMYDLKRAVEHYLDEKCVDYSCDFGTQLSGPYAHVLEVVLRDVSEGLWSRVLLPFLDRAAEKGSETITVEVEALPFSPLRRVRYCQR